ncbi:MAG: asparagine synthase (glutamine-hydrolyzing) [bacterium]|nr:asparagine synthase (glutamine-hydrolyzing) [bacterium]
MCGILTIYKKEGIGRSDLDSSLKSLNIIKHRGPDGEGLILINTKNQEYEVILTADTPKGISGIGIEEIDFNKGYDLLLAHRRLSIFDLSIKGHQPLFYKEQVIVFNGEIYNFHELKEILIETGYTFTSGTDTEVILAAYNHWGKDCFAKFNGMWSLAIYNLKTGELTVSNDRYGVKPLYYFIEDQNFILMSEPKQILAFPEKMRGINTRAVNIFMDLGYLFIDHGTFFKDIFRFPIASHYCFKAGEKNLSFIKGPEKFYVLPNIIKNDISQAEVIKTFKKLFSDAVKIRLRSDVKLGIALSGGLDSTSIAFVAKEVLQNHNFTTFSVIAEKGSEGDESYYINLANKQLDSENIQVNPLYDFNKESFLNQIYQIGSPVADTSFFAQYILNKVIKKNGVTVLLTGQGGDEILAGYHHHFYKYTSELFRQGKIIKGIKEINKWSKLKGKSKRSVLNSAFFDFYLTTKTKLGLSKFPFDFQNKIFSTKRLIDFLKLEIEMLQLPYFLLADDRFSMASAVETRNPFLDYRLVDFVFSLPNQYKIRDGWQKWLLRETMSEMPDEIRYRKDKKGFTTPMQSWIASNQEMLNSLALVSDQYFPEHISKPLFKRAAMGAWIQNFIIKN